MGGEFLVPPCECLTPLRAQRGQAGCYLETVKVPDMLPSFLFALVNAVSV